MIVAMGHRMKEVSLKGDTTGDPSKFTIQTFGARAKAFVQNALVNLASDGKTPMLCNGSYMLAAVAAGVVDWTPIKDEAGKEVKPAFTRREGLKVLSDASLDALAEHIQELGALVLEYNGMTETDEGNSGASPVTPPAS